MKVRTDYKFYFHVSELGPFLQKLEDKNQIFTFSNHPKKPYSSFPPTQSDCREIPNLKKARQDGRGVLVKITVDMLIQ